MNAHDWKQLISAYADGQVTPDERAQAEKLLAERPECQAYLDQLRALSSSLHVLNDQPLSPDAQMNILSTIKKERPMTTLTWKPAAAVISTVVVAMLVFNMQQYAARSTQGRLKASADDIADQYAPAAVGRSTAQYAALRKQDEMATAGRAAGADKDALLERKAVNELVPQTLAMVTPVESDMFAPANGGAVRGDLFKEKAALPAAMPIRAQAQAPAGQVSTPHMGYANGAVLASPGMLDARRANLASRIPAQASVDGWAQPTAAGGLVIQRIVPIEEMGYPAPAVVAGQEEYPQLADNPFLDAQASPLSTFSIDVDTASYSNVRRFLAQGQLPPKDAVRVEELVNYFGYDYPRPKGKEPFSITTNVAVCPWNTGHQLVHIGLKGRIPSASQLSASNLVFLIDVSGSMNTYDKLPVIKEGLKMMVDQLRPQDRISLVVYAGNAGLVLDSTAGDQKWAIDNAIDSLQAGGSTAGGEGIALAYNIARQNFIPGGNNRVVLATDGDFNVGVTNTDQLVGMMEQERRGGIFLTILGVGQDNLKDNRMQQLADKGDGNYFYLDSLNEARKVLVDELGSTLYTIAKDVKIQVEFNPAVVQSYRLIGYEKRALAKEDFNNDRKDAGEIGAGHTVTALYEIVPAGGAEGAGRVDPLKYQANWKWPFSGGEVMTVKLRYKEPSGGASKLITRTIKKTDVQDEPAGDFAWAASVAEFGMLLRNAPDTGSASYADVISRASRNMGADPYGLKAEFLNMAERARQLSPYQQNNGNGQVQFK